MAIPIPSGIPAVKQRARGAVTVDLAWKGGQLGQAAIRPDRDGEILVRLGGVTKKLAGKAGAPIKLGRADFAP